MNYSFYNMLLAASVAVSIYAHVHFNIHYMVLAIYWSSLIVFLRTRGLNVRREAKKEEKEF